MTPKSRAPAPRGSSSRFPRCLVGARRLATRGAIPASAPRAAPGEWPRAEDREAPGADQSRPRVGVFVIHMEETWRRPGPRSPSALRAATSAAVALSSRAGGGADMELWSPRRLLHRALCGEQGKTRGAAEPGEEGSKWRTTGKKAPAPASPNAVQEEREEPLLFYAPPFPFFPLKRFGGRSARCAVPSWTTLVIGFFGAQSSGLAHAESRREVAGGGDGTGVRESSTRGRGAGRALQLDWVSVDFTLQRTRQPPLSSSRDYIPVKRFRKEGGLARNSPGL